MNRCMDQWNNIFMTGSETGGAANLMDDKIKTELISRGSKSVP